MFDQALFDQIVFDGQVIEEVTQKSVSDSGVGTDVVAIKGTIPVADSGAGVETIGIKEAVNIVESKFKKALSFDGVDDYVNCGDLSIAESKKFSYAAWIKTTQTGNDKWIVSEGNNTDTIPISGLVNQNGVTRAYFRNNARGAVDISGTKTINDGNWHFLVSTADGNTLRIYTDGELENSGPLPTGDISLTTAAIGALIRATVSCFVKGLIDEVRIYNRALSAEEIKEHYSLSKRNLKF